MPAYADQDTGMVLVAHSKGNLFVNLAYDGLKAARPNANIDVIHVATATPTLRAGVNDVEDYALADIDLIINALRLTGTVQKY